MRFATILLALAALFAPVLASAAVAAPAPSASPRPHHARATADALAPGCTYTCPPAALAARYGLQRARSVRSGALCAYADAGARSPALTCAFAPVRLPARWLGRDR
jgi:hypothetical protein